MKKLFSFALVLALALSMSTTVFAATIGTDGGTQDIEVNAKYVDGTDSPTKYSVDIVWGAMEFTYSVSGTKTWNASTHEYEVSAVGGWTANGNEIVVTNHSNAGIDVDFIYAQESGFETVSGSFSKVGFSLPTAEDKAVDNAALTEKTALTLNGTLASDKTEFTKVGTVTAEISKLKPLIETESQLEAAFKSGGRYTLSSDLTMTKGIGIFDLTKPLELDLNGNTLAHSDARTAVIVSNNATVTVKNGTLHTQDSVVYINDDVDLTFENCTLQSDDGYAIEMIRMSGSSSVKLVNCVVTGNDALGALYVDGKQKLTMSGNTAVNGKIDACEGSKIVCLAGTYNFDPSAYVDTVNFTVTEADGAWTVTAK